MYSNNGWIYSNNGWMDSNNGWMDSNNGWMDSNNGWMDSNNGWMDSNTGWMDSNEPRTLMSMPLKIKEEMALEPRVRRSASKRWHYIKGGWVLDAVHHSEPVYYGHAGDGTLDPNIGADEYLDKTAIEKAKVRAMAMGRTLNCLSIKTLTLTGFVVDADPFIHWFDPKRLQCINFKDYCVDAGFYLPWPTRKVAIHYSRDVSKEPVSVRRVDLLRDLKVIELKGGKKGWGDAVPWF